MKRILLSMLALLVFAGCSSNKINPKVQGEVIDSAKAAKIVSKAYRDSAQKWNSYGVQAKTHYLGSQLSSPNPERYRNDISATETRNTLKTEDTVYDVSYTEIEGMDGKKLKADITKEKETYEFDGELKRDDSFDCTPIEKSKSPADALKKAYGLDAGSIEDEAVFYKSSKDEKDGKTIITMDLVDPKGYTDYSYKKAKKEDKSATKEMELQDGNKINPYKMDKITMVYTINEDGTLASYDYSSSVWYTDHIFNEVTLSYTYFDTNTIDMDIEALDKAIETKADFDNNFDFTITLNQPK